MDLIEAIDVDSIPDTQDASASDQAAQSSGKVSSMYAVWDVARTDEMRSHSHRGAWCNPCLKHGVKKDPKGHFLAQIDAILTRVKDCPRRSAAIKQSAAAELRVIRDKKKKGPLAGVKLISVNAHNTMQVCLCYSCHVVHTVFCCSHFHIVLSIPQLSATLVRS